MKAPGRPGRGYAWIAALLGAGLLAGCLKDSPPSSPGNGEKTGDPRPYSIGVSGMVPPNWPNPNEEDWGVLFADIPLFGELWGMHVGWSEGELDSAGVPVTVRLAHNVTQGTGITPYIAVGFEPDALSPQEVDAYIANHGEGIRDVIVTIAARHKPGILLIGVEINRYFEKSPEGFADFVDLYHDVYDSVKVVSPETMVGSNFLLEYMRGAGARSGTTRQEHWHLLDAFEPRLDLASFTLFPFLDFDNPADIPDDYLEVIAAHTERPVMITETGWPSKPVAAAPALQASDSLQVVYLEKLLGLAETVPMHALIWVFPHDPETGQAGSLFDNVGLRNNDGSPKPAFDLWKELAARPVEAVTP